MDFHKLFGFLTILKEAFKIFSKNGKIMAFLIFLTVSFYSILFLSIFFSIKQLFADMFSKLTLLISTSPQSPEYFYLLLGIKKDMGYVLGVEWIFILISSIVFLIFAIAIIIASAAINSGKNLSVKDLLSSTLKSFQKPLVTYFYIALFSFGYSFLILATLFPLMLIFDNPILSRASSIITIILAAVLQSYISIVWILSLVISVLEEENYGYAAIGKAAKIVKGMKLDGFVMNLVFVSISLLLVEVMQLIPVKSASKTLQIILILLVTILIWLIGMFKLMAYTIFYFKCKKAHGEDIDFPKCRFEYSKIDSAPVPLLNENIA